MMQGNASTLIIAGAAQLRLLRPAPSRRSADAPGNRPRTKPAARRSKGRASPRPWKRYTGWPARDMSKFNTLANLASPPAPKEPRKLSGADHRRCRQRRRSWSPTATAAARASPATSWVRPATPICRAMSGLISPRSAMPAARTSGCSITSTTRRVYNPETVMPPWGTHGLFNEQEISDIVAFLKTLKSPAKYPQPRSTIPTSARRRSRSATISIRSGQSRHVGGRARAGAVEGNGPSRLRPATSCHTDAGDAVQDLGGGDAEVGAAARQGARRRGVRLLATPRRRPARTG